jgi:hypothetical protein
MAVAATECKTSSVASKGTWDSHDCAENAAAATIRTPKVACSQTANRPHSSLAGPDSANTSQPEGEKAGTGQPDPSDPLGRRPAGGVRHPRV